MKMTPILAALAVLLLAGYVYAGNFTDNGNGTVSDSVTGLMWQKCSAGQNNDSTCSGTSQTYQWQGAFAFCNGLSLAGHSDWRLPNVKELHSIVDDTVSKPAINTTPFPNTESSSYWSSTTYASNPSSAWLVGFDAGGVGYYGKTDVGYVRCVR